MQYREILDRLIYSGVLTEQESEIIFKEAGNPKLHTSTYSRELLMAGKEWIDVWNNPIVWEEFAGFPEIRTTRHGRHYLVRLIAWRTAQRAFSSEVPFSQAKRFRNHTKLKTLDDVY